MGKILGFETAFLGESNGQRIAHREGRRRTRGGGQTQRTGLAPDADVQHDVASTSQGGIRITDQTD